MFKLLKHWLDYSFDSFYNTQEASVIIFKFFENSKYFQVL